MQQDVDILKNTVLSRARLLRESMEREADEKKEAALQEFRTALTLQEEARFAAEASRCRAAANEKIATLQMEEHRALLLRREEMIAALKEEVEEALRDFVKTPEYTAHLKDSIRRVAEKYEGETLFLEVCRKEDVEVAVEYAEVRLAEEDFLGGFRLGIPARRMAVDESLRSRMEDAFSEFHEIRIESEEAKA